MFWRNDELKFLAMYTHTHACITVKAAWFKVRQNVWICQKSHFQIFHNFLAWYFFNNNFWQYTVRNFSSPFHQNMVKNWLKSSIRWGNILSVFGTRFYHVSNIEICFTKYDVTYYQMLADYFAILRSQLFTQFFTMFWWNDKLKFLTVYITF